MIESVRYLGGDKIFPKNRSDCLGAIDISTRVLLLIVPQFNLLTLSAMIEPMRAVNRLAERRLYEWTVIAKDLTPIVSSNGLSIAPDTTLARAPAADLVIVCASFEVPEFNDRELRNFLRRRATMGGLIGGTDSGSVILARAGLLDGHRCSVHWESQQAFAEEFPKVSTSSHIYAIDRNRITCGGGVAALDMMLHVIAQKHGPQLGLNISSALLHARLRSPDDHQRSAVTLGLEQRSPRMGKALSLMEEHIENPLPIPEISQRIGLAQRQVERLFHTHFGVTPQQYYLDLRLDFARQLVLNTSMSVRDVAVASGFASATYFSQRYCKRFGMTPAKHRSDRSSGAILAESTTLSEPRRRS